MSKHPVEVFGHPIDTASPLAADHRLRHWCPFLDSGCDKQSRLVDYPFGVCSVQYAQEIIALCPRRFVENQTVFLDIADHHFGARHDLLLFEEVSVPTGGRLGRFDYVLARHKPLSNQIEDFVVIEFQTGQTTSTGRLVQGFKDFMQGQDVAGQTYAFGLNLADIWKRTFTQVLTKGIALESWGHQIYWVVQEPVYRSFINRYHLHGLGYDPTHKTVFAVYDLQRSGDRFVLYQTRRESSTIDHLLEAFRTNFDVPDKRLFIQKLEERAKRSAAATLRLDLRPT